MNNINQKKELIKEFTENQNFDFKLPELPQPPKVKVREFPNIEHEFQLEKLKHTIQIEKNTKSHWWLDLLYAIIAGVIVVIIQQILF